MCETHAQAEQGRLVALCTASCCSHISADFLNRTDFLFLNRLCRVVVKHIRLPPRLLAACPVCFEDTTAWDNWGISNISDQQAVRVWNQSNQWVNKYVLKAFHIGKYHHVNENWIFFLPHSTLPLTHNLLWGPSVQSLTLNQMQRYVVLLKWKSRDGIWALGPHRPLVHVTQSAVCW